MQRNWIRIVVGFSTLASALPAAELTYVDSFRVASNSTLSKANYVICEKGSIEGDTTDDLFVASPSLEIRGTVGNDLWFVGGMAQSELKLHSGAHVADHVRCAAASIELSGEIGNELLAAGMTINITTSALVRGDATLYAKSTAVLSGHMAGNVTVYAEKATISGRIDGSLRVEADDVVFLPGAEIRGDLIHTSEQSIDFKRIKVGGKVSQVSATRADDATPWFGMFFSAASSLLTGIVLLLAFPTLIVRSVDQIRMSYGKTSMTGLLGLALLALLALAGLFTLVGIPLALLAGCLLFAFMYIGKIVVAVALGLTLLRWHGPLTTQRLILSLLAGLIPIAACDLIPEFGGILIFLAQVTGLGALLLVILQRRSVNSPTPQPVMAP